MKNLLVVMMLVACGTACVSRGRSVVVTFVAPERVLVMGREYDVSSKCKALDMRLSVKTAKELIFDQTEAGSLRGLWNIVDFYGDCTTNTCLITPASYAIRLKDGSDMPLHFGSRDSYYVIMSNDVGLSVEWNENPESIDFSPVDKCGGVPVFIEIKCDCRTMRSLAPIVPILERFSSHGANDRVACLLLY